MVQWFIGENLRVNIWRDKFTSDYLSEPSIVKLIENKSDLSKLSIFSESKRTLIKANFISS